MYRGHSIGVVVPAYNEQEHVGEVIRTLPDVVDRAYVVNDGSTDDTWEAIQAAAQEVNRVAAAAITDGGKRVVPIQHDENRGVGGAIKTGYQRARDDDLDVVAVMGGDGQMDPSKLHMLLDPIVEGRADYSKGNRLLRPEDREGMPRFRLVGNYLLTLLTKIASGCWSVGDPQNGYTAISASALEETPIDEMYEYYGYCNDLLVKLRVSGQRVADVRMPAEYGEEESHITYSEYIPRVSWILLKNFGWRLRRHLADGTARGTALSYLVGSVLLAIGLMGWVLSTFGVTDAGAQSAFAVFMGVSGIGAGVVTDWSGADDCAVRVDPEATAETTP